MRLPSVKRITGDNTPTEVQPVVENLATILNPFMEDVTAILNKGITFDNLAFPVYTIEVMVNSKGIPLIGGQLPLNKLPLGSQCINVQDSSNLNAIPDITALPVLFFNQGSSGSVNISKVLNLLPNKKYLLTVIIY